MRSSTVTLALLLAATLPALPASGVGVGGWQVDTHSILQTPRRVRLALLDGDGLPDLAYTAGELTFLTATRVGVWLNRGDGSFTRHWGDVVTSDFGDNGVALESADIDEDGLGDLILGNANGTGGFLVRLGDGSGSFPDESYGPSYGGYIDDASVADYDGDGHVDVGTTTHDLGWYVDRFDGFGDGGFGFGLAFSVFPGGFGPHEMASGDVTGDGLPDDLVSGPNGLWLVPSVAPTVSLLDMPLDRAVVADLDGDGLADVAATAPLDHSVQVLRSLGDGDFATALRVPVGRRPAGLVELDIDLDGDLDLAVTHAGTRSLGLLLNQGDGTFVAGERVDVGSGPVDVAAADLDGDGDPDLVTANAGDDSLSVLLNPRL